MITLVNGNSNSQEPTNSPKRQKIHFFFPKEMKNLFVAQQRTVKTQ